MNIKQNLLYFLCKTIYRPLPIEENNVKHIISVEYKDLLIEKNTTFNVCKLNIQNKSTKRIDNKSGDFYKMPIYGYLLTFL